MKYRNSSSLLPLAWISLALLMLAGDYLTGPIIQFPILYVFPIALATWYSGLRWGVALALLLPFGRVWFALMWHTPWRTMSDVVGNTAIRIVAFSLMVFLIHKVITKSKDVKERRAAEQKLKEQQRQLRVLAADLAVAEETERRRIAAGLHDDINQMLIAAKLKLAMLPSANGPDAVAGISADIEKALDRVLATSQSLVFDLVSPVLQKFGLEAALGDLCERMEHQHAIAFSFVTEGETGDMNDETGIILFHAVRELLRNVVRHAEASRVNVIVRNSKNVVTIIVQDDGRGFDKATDLEGLTPSGGYGLFTIHERMQYLGGSVRIDPVLPHGSRIELVLPMNVKEVVR